MPSVCMAVITLFSLRQGFFGSVKDPLAPDRLEHRFNVFEYTVLPSMVAQSMQDFHWMLFIDPELPGHYRERLEALVAVRPNTHLVVRGPGPGYRSLAWLKPWVPEGCEAVVTVQCDDDDGLHSHYLEALMQSTREALEDGTHPPLRFHGSEQGEQWDLVASDEAPLGWRKPWTRRDFNQRTYPVSAGFALAVRYPGIDCSIIGFAHSVTCNALQLDAPLPTHIPETARRIEAFRERLGDGAERGGVELPRLDLETHYRLCTLPSPQVVMTNHGANLQHRRLDEVKVAPTPVTEAGFPGIAFDLDMARARMERSAFRRN